MKRRRHRPEDTIHRSVVAHLRARAVPNVIWWHTFNGAFFSGKRNAKGVAIQGAIGKSLGVRAGVSDIIAVHNGRVFGLELKAPGARPTESQMQFAADLNAAGGFATIVEGIDQAIATLERWGLLRGQTS